MVAVSNCLTLRCRATYLRETFKRIRIENHYRGSLRIDLLMEVVVRQIVVHHIKKVLNAVWSKFSSGPLLHARTSLRAQVYDKSGSVDPLLGPDRKHPHIYVRLPDTNRCPYLYAYAASRS
jgi:hypothetical protein